MNRLLLLIRREFWEHRAFVIAPAIVAVVMLIVAIFGVNDFANVHVELPSEFRLAEHHQAALAAVLAALTLPFWIVMSTVVVFYLLDSLYADRKDRSVLFWKSLPVSDGVTVTSKLLTAAVALPLLTFAVALATNLLVALISSVRLSGIDGLDIWRIAWEPRSWFGVHVLLLYAVIACMLWILPVVAWLLIASAWARRAVILWAALPPLVLMYVEQKLIGTFYVASALRDRFVGWFSAAFDEEAARSNHVTLDGESIPWPAALTDVVDPVGFLSSPGLWIGLVTAAAFLWGAIQIRRRRTEV